MISWKRPLVATSATMLAMSFGCAVAEADPSTPGTPCGADKVVTSINTCEPLNSSCTGYDSMIIGRVAASGRCVIPGLDGTNW